MPCLPKLSAFVLLRRPLKISATKFFGEFARHLCLFLDPRRAAMKLKKQGRLHRIFQAGVLVYSVHLHFVEQLNTSHGNTRLNRHYYCVDGTL